MGPARQPVSLLLSTQPCEVDRRARHLAPRPALLWLMPLLLAILGSTARGGTFPMTDEVEEVLQFTLPPAAITAAPSGDWLVALDARQRPRYRAAHIRKSGEVTPFPDQAMSLATPEARLPLDAIEALVVDTNGIVWMLDNGRRSEMIPKLIGWDTGKDRLHRLIHLHAPAVIPGSFCADLTLEPSGTHAYIADPANGADAAIITVDLETGLCRRLLHGHSSVRPDSAIKIPPDALASRAIRRLDGATALPHCGIESVAVDRKGDWLYFSAFQAAILYRVATHLLRDPATPPDDLASAVEAYASKPPTSGLAIDNKSNLYLGDIGSRSIGMVDARDRTYRPLVSDARLIWPDGLTFGQDGRLYFFSPNRTSAGASGTSVLAPVPPAPPSPAFSLFRIRTPANGRAGD